MTCVDDFKNTCACDDVCVVAIGIFDAVHLGHRKVLREALAFAHEKLAKLFVFTFYPHPAKVIARAGNTGDLIYTPEIREKLLLEVGVDRVFFKNFNLDFASKSPEDFILYLREKFPNMTGVITGENFKFGKKASADVKWLRENCQKFGFEARAASGVLQDGEFVSSSRLRLALREGDMQKFRDMASRPYFCEGEVVGGKHLGRTIGFPTLNLKWNPECKLPYGSYASILTNLQNGEKFYGVSNYGINPTVENAFPLLETNLFETPDFSEGAKIKVELLHFIRKEIKFSSLSELKLKIAEDKQRAIAYFAENKENLKY